MEQFPGNSKIPPRQPKEEPKKEIQRVVEGGIIRRKPSRTRRLTKHLLGEEGAWGFMMNEVVAPGLRHILFDAFTGGMERAVFRDGRRGPSRYGSGHVDYRAPYRRPTGPEPRQSLSRRAREMHNFDEFVIPHRADADETLDRLNDLTMRYDSASVADLYRMLGEPVDYTDNKYGWVKGELQHAMPRRVQGGYLLDLPRPQPLD